MDEKRFLAPNGMVAAKNFSVDHFSAMPEALVLRTGRQEWGFIFTLKMECPPSRALFLHSVRGEKDVDKPIKSVLMRFLRSVHERKDSDRQIGSVPMRFLRSVHEGKDADRQIGNVVL